MRLTFTTSSEVMRYSSTSALRISILHLPQHIQFPTVLLLSVLTLHYDAPFPFRVPRMSFVPHRQVNLKSNAAFPSRLSRCATPQRHTTPHHNATPHRHSATPQRHTTTPHHHTTPPHHDALIVVDVVVVVVVVSPHCCVRPSVRPSVVQKPETGVDMKVRCSKHYRLTIPACDVGIGALLCNLCCCCCCCCCKSYHSNE